MKLLAFLAVITGVLALGTAQLQVTPGIQTRNAEGVWAVTLLRSSGLETSSNSQVINRIVIRGAGGLWQTPLSTPTQLNPQTADRIVVRRAWGIWRSPLKTPDQFSVQPSVRIVARNAASLWRLPLSKPNLK